MTQTMFPINMGLAPPPPLDYEKEAEFIVHYTCDEDQVDQTQVMHVGSLRARGHRRFVRVSKETAAIRDRDELFKALALAAGFQMGRFGDAQLSTYSPQEGLLFLRVLGSKTSEIESWIAQLYTTTKRGFPGAPHVFAIRTRQPDVLSTLARMLEKKDYFFTPKVVVCEIDSERFGYISIEKGIEPSIGDLNDKETVSIIFAPSIKKGTFFVELDQQK